MPTFKFSSIFETHRSFDPTLAVYPTVKAHLDAEQAGTKGMSLFGFPIGYMAEGGADYVSLLEEAFKRELVVVLQCKLRPKTDFALQEPRVLVARPEELWRVPAFLALWETAYVGGSWSHASEALESLLLGYTPKQRARWIESTKQWRAAYGQQSAFVLLTKEQRERVIDLGMRCLGSSSEIEGMQVVANRTGCDVKAGAFRRIPKGHTLARFGLPWAAYQEIFGSTETWGRRRLLKMISSKAVVKTLSRSQRTNVQFLTARGWR